MRPDKFLITRIQTIGKILAWHYYLYTTNKKLHARLSKIKSRLAQLEAKPNNGEPPTIAEGGF